MDIESIILKGLISDENYTRKVTPYLKREYFRDKAQQVVYLIADNYFRKYNTCATKEVLLIEADKLKGMNDELYSQAVSVIDSINLVNLNTDHKWLVDNTEEFTQDRALHLALAQALDIYQKPDSGKLSKTAIPEIMRQALAVGFDDKLGHDFVEDTESQLEFYHSTLSRIPFDVDVLNDVTNGGFARKTLSLLIAGCVDENTTVNIRINPKTIT